MFSSIKSFGVSGIGGYGVSVEVYISNGLPSFDIVGLPDAAVKEARERVRAAIKNNGFRFPVSRLTINLAPADKKKAGTVFKSHLLFALFSFISLNIISFSFLSNEVQEELPNRLTAASGLLFHPLLLLLCLLSQVGYFTSCIGEINLCGSGSYLG